MQSQHPKFTVVYSAVKTVRMDKFPLRVTITTDAFQNQHKVWSGKQVNLYEKYPKRRRKAMDIIKASLADLKETLLCRPEAAGNLEAARVDVGQSKEIVELAKAGPGGAQKAVLVDAV